MKWLPLIGRQFLLLLLVALPLPAFAHDFTNSPVPGGAVPIPSIKHGEMTVMARNRAAILSLAARQPALDGTSQRLLNFINGEFALCFWGLVPGSVTDEQSPFNQCTHAYLAATSALLLHLRGMDNASDETAALYDKVAIETIMEGTSTILCQYSAEAFNTATFVPPDVTMIVAHPPSVVALGGISLATFGAGLAITRRRRKA